MNGSERYSDHEQLLQKLLKQAGVEEYSTVYLDPALNRSTRKPVTKNTKGKMVSKYRVVTQGGSNRFWKEHGGWHTLDEYYGTISEAKSAATQVLSDYPEAEELLIRAEQVRVDSKGETNQNLVTVTIPESKRKIRMTYTVEIPKAKAKVGKYILHFEYIQL